MTSHGDLYVGCCVKLSWGASDDAAGSTPTAKSSTVSSRGGVARRPSYVGHVTKIRPKNSRRDNPSYDVRGVYGGSCYLGADTVPFADTVFGPSA